MQDMDDIELLRQYAEHDSEEAFTVLVQRHVNLVYSIAFRHVANAHRAEEITQAVFVILARKARKLRPGTVLSGWLYHTARLTAANAQRSEIQRTRREQEAYLQSTITENESDAWTQIGPWLDHAMAGLNEKDRNAIVLRFFEGRNLREVGTAIGASEEAAKKRVTRALERLRHFFSKRGITLTAAGLAAAVSANSIQAAPAGLAISAVAAAKGSAATASTLTLVKGALKVMAWTKLKLAAVVGVAVILTASTTTVIIKKSLDDRGDADQLMKEGWEMLQSGHRSEAVAKFDRAVKLDPKNPDAWNGRGWVSFNSGRPQEAEQAFQKVLALNPTHPAALNGMGQLYLAKKDYEQAESWLLKAAPQASAAWFGLARIYLVQGKFDQAEEWAQKLVDSGDMNDMAKQMLEAAKKKELTGKLRQMLEPK